jgi:thioredoxin 1
MTNQNTITVTAADFDTVVASGTPTLVDFWADWCGPCHAIAPVLEELAAEHEGELTVAKLNVDENSDIALDHEVMSIPTLIIFKDGVEKKRLVGAQPKAHIEAELAEFIA